MKPCRTKRTWLVLIGMVLSLGLIGGYLTLLNSLRTDDGIVICGHRYSSTLRDLYDEVSMLYKKPIRVIKKREIPDHLTSCFREDMTNALYTHDKDIWLLLQEQPSEDVIAHELMHAVLRTEGYPELWSVGISPLGQKLAVIVAGFLDHLVINGRLLEIGYDARAGFLSRADGPENILKLDVPDELPKRIVLYFVLLHELAKFRHYIGDIRAEEALLAKFPEVAPYWETLSFQIRNLPQRPKPHDLWDIGVAFIQMGDRMCTDAKVDVLISDIVGLNSAALDNNDMSRPAKDIFTQTTEPVGSQQVVVRIFLVEPRVMVSCVVVPRGSPMLKAAEVLSVRDYLLRLNVEFISKNK